MVDYVPLIARAVASLNPNTSEQRRALYERARKTLVDKLRSTDPALLQTDLKAERAALEAAILRVERDAVRRTAPPQPRQGYEPYEYRDRPPLKDPQRHLRLVGAAVGFLFILIAGVATYTFWPNIVGGTRNITPAPRAVAVAPEPPDAKSSYVRLRQLVYYRTNQPVGTIVVDKSQTFLYVVRPNVSALRYSIGVGNECITLAGLYHVVRKEEPTQQSAGTSPDPKKPVGARVLYLNDDHRIHGSEASPARSRLDGCIRLVDDDVIYLYDRTPLESRVVISN
jgi:lipoprotein-anchoring transpeptidase ErfK/SrfK